MKSIVFRVFALFLLSALLVGCAAAMPTAIPTPTVTAGPSPTMTLTPLPTVTPYSGPLTVKYFGRSCILIMAPDGTLIVSDPYTGKLRRLEQLPGNLQADAVTVSHAHSDHNAVDAVTGSPQVFDAPGEYQIGSIKVTGYQGYEGSPSGPSEMSNTIFVYEVDGAKIVQLGDSGPVTDPDVLAGIADADLILINIDMYVFPIDEIMPFMQQIGAHTIVPAHYDIVSNGTSLYINNFLNTLTSDITVVQEDSEIQVTPDMPAQVVVMAPLMFAK